MVMYAFNFCASGRLQLEGTLLLSFSYRDCGRICISVAFHCFYISNVSGIFV